MPSSLARIVGAALVATLSAAGLTILHANAAGQTPAGRAQAPGRGLTGPAAGDALDLALKYLRDQRQALGLSAADLNDVVVTSRYVSEHTSVTHVYLRQRFNGIDIYNGDAGIHVGRDGSILSATSGFIGGLAGAVNRASPARAATQGVADAARGLGLRLTSPVMVRQQRGGPAAEVLLSDGGIAARDIPAKLVYQPVDGGRLRLAWLVEIEEIGGAHVWVVTVDAESGALLSREDQVVEDDWDVPNLFTGGPLKLIPDNRHAETAAAGEQIVVTNGYNVFAIPKESPSDGPRTLEVDPADPTASPFAWHDTNGAAGAEFTITRGNNVHAYTDIDANNIADPGSSPDGGADLVFDFPLDLGQGPATYRPAAVTNLFYWNNIIHDVLYGYGFNEASGSFQVNNYGGGGLGNDDVRAEAQDGSGTNNANFFTPVDGSRPRMQMFVWTPPFVNVVTVNGGPIAGDYPATGAAFGPDFPTTGLTGNLELVNDGAGSSATDACEPLVGFTPGTIALLDRGSCTFVIKVANAQAAGAIGVVVANNVGGNPITMGGTDPTIIIPAGMVSQTHGDLFKGSLPLNVTVRSNSAVNPNRDSDLDAGVIVHEYGHGVSNRLTGGPATASCLNNAEQMGEGWSDFLALVLTAKSGQTGPQRRGIGTYLIYQGTDGQGIRPAPYSTDMAVNPVTYSALPGLAIPHGVGYAWASMVWEVYWNLVDKHGFNPDVYGDWTTGGNNLALQLVMDGMKLQACRPGFVDGRNAILQADTNLTGGANQCLIWRGFAKRGLGYSASQGANTSTTDGTEAFDLPPLCSSLEVSPTSLSSTQISGVTTVDTLTVSNTSATDGMVIDWTITEAASDCASPGDLPWVSAAPTSGSNDPGTDSSVTVTFDSTGLGIGTYTGKLCLSSNATASPLIEVPLSLTVIYTFSGFFPPIANLPAVNPVLAGSVVPVKFSLAGFQGLSVLQAGSPSSQRVNCSTGTPQGASEAAETAGDSPFTYSAADDQYVFAWKTKAQWRNTCRDLTVALVDGTSHVARFRF